jgi:crossover junction endodeoxyribonuclease RuvC
MTSLGGAFLGIDPGLSGALALYIPSTDTLHVGDVPIHEIKRAGRTKREVDVHGLVSMFRDCAVHRPTVWLEQVGTMPGEGPVGAFTFGKTVGILTGVAIALDLVLERVPPQVWKKALAVLADKDAARARASALLPRHAHCWALKKHDGRAEAALIAIYGARQAQRIAA